MKIIQICGTHGVGKTTLVKALLQSGKFLKFFVPVYGENREFWFDGNIAIIGKYSSINCCGVDAGNYSADALITTIKQIIVQQKPNIVLFEDIRFGLSFTFKDRLRIIANELGYEYSVLALIASLRCSCNRVLDRSGNIYRNYDGMRSKAMQVIRSSLKLKKAGSKVLFCDTEKNDEVAVLSVLRGMIYD